MRLLLDTHAFLWWLGGDPRMSRGVRSLVADEGNEILVSAASVWEITTKARLGKLPGALSVAADVPACIASQGFVGLPITPDHAQRAGTLGGDHRDPFDRMLVAQAQAEGLSVVSADGVFDDYRVTRVWWPRLTSIRGRWARPFRRPAMPYPIARPDSCLAWQNRMSASRWGRCSTAWRRIWRSMTLRTRSWWPSESHRTSEES